MIEFHVQQDSGHIEVMLGTQLVGTIQPCEDPHKLAPLGISACYSLKLPIDGSPGRDRAAANVTMARRQILYRIAEWFESAGISFRPIAYAVRAQAEAER